MKNIEQIQDYYFSQSKSVMYVTCDEDWVILSGNSFFCDILGGVSGVVGSSFFDHLVKESSETIKAIEDRETYHRRVLLQTKEGASLAVECTISFGASSWVIIGERPMLTNSDVLQKMTALQNEMVNLARELQKKNRQLEHANQTIKTLRGIIPICSFCKGIRDDKGYWQRLEEYMGEMTEAEFSHSVCPKCMEEHYPDLFQKP